MSNDSKKSTKKRLEKVEKLAKRLKREIREINGAGIGFEPYYELPYTYIDTAMDAVRKRHG